MGPAIYDFSAERKHIPNDSRKKILSLERIQANAARTSAAAASRRGGGICRIFYFNVDTLKTTDLRNVPL